MVGRIFIVYIGVYGSAAEVCHSLMCIEGSYSFLYSHRRSDTYIGPLSRPLTVLSLFHLQSGDEHKWLIGKRSHVQVRQWCNRSPWYGGAVATWNLLTSRLLHVFSNTKITNWWNEPPGAWGVTLTLACRELALKSPASLRSCLCLLTNTNMCVLYQRWGDMLFEPFPLFFLPIEKRCPKALACSHIRATTP